MRAGGGQRDGVRVVAHERGDARALLVREAQALAHGVDHLRPDALVLVERVVLRLVAEREYH